MFRINEFSHFQMCSFLGLAVRWHLQFFWLFVFLHFILPFTFHLCFSDKLQLTWCASFLLVLSVLIIATLLSYLMYPLGEIQNTLYCIALYMDSSTAPCYPLPNIVGLRNVVPMQTVCFALDDLCWCFFIGFQGIALVLNAYARLGITNTALFDYFAQVRTLA